MATDEDTIRGTRTGDLFIRFSPVKLLLVFVPLALLVALSLLVNFESWQRAEPSTVATFVVIPALVLLACVVLPRRYYLRLSPEGLTVHYLGARRFYAWEEMYDIRVASQSGLRAATRFVVFDLARDSPRRTATHKLSKMVNGYDVGLMAVYELRAEVIVALLTEWRRRYREARE
jgi:hypothetical protein